MDTDTDNTVYRVVINDEDQYSIWPTYRELPAGWHPLETTGTKQACLDFVREHWNDMRPRSLRERLEATGRPS